MSKSKKTAKIPKPIRVKKEKTEEDRSIHSMAHYVDDRLELVKQIFGSLKKKTITNLAPEFLKDKEIDEIQELCLNELLCYSKKRLLSIINATKCPTDTESSDDSDVEAKEEHVSLEEISSDSEIENGGKVSKKPGGSSQSRIRKNSKKRNQSVGKTESNGQISVLELLELQARARAIRLQLAMEPVAKIEVDSETENEETSKSATATETTPREEPWLAPVQGLANYDSLKSTAATTTGKEIIQKPKKSHAKHLQLEKASSSSKEKTTNSSLSKSRETMKSPSATYSQNESAQKYLSKQKIKINRNFRKDNNNSQTEATNTDNLQKVEEESTNKCHENEVSKEVKKEKLSLSPSPEVVPIEAEPETFCISDSCSEDENKVMTKQTQKSMEPTSHSEETEDAEIIDQSNTAEGDKMLEKVKVREATKENSIDINNIGVNLQDDSLKHLKDSGVNISGDNISTSDVTNTHTEDNSLTLHYHDDGHGDDVISIEGGDFENEMSEHMDEDTNSKNSTAHESKDERIQSNAKGSENNDIDIVSIDSSENEDETTTNDRNEESWRTRYMRSSKVNKVLAVSRLGKRVRDKLKNPKRSNRNSTTENSAKDEVISSKYISQHEDGSVDQYKELIKISQRKI